MLMNVSDLIKFLNKMYFTKIKCLFLAIKKKYWKMLIIVYANREKLYVVSFNFYVYELWLIKKCLNI